MRVVRVVGECISSSILLIAVYRSEQKLLGRNAIRKYQVSLVDTVNIDTIFKFLFAYFIFAKVDGGAPLQLAGVKFDEWNFRYSLAFVVTHTDCRTTVSIWGPCSERSVSSWQCDLSLQRTARC